MMTPTAITASQQHLLSRRDGSASRSSRQARANSPKVERADMPSSWMEF